MADIKLFYFQARGRVEPIRMTLAVAGKKFEDVRLTGEQWAAEKDKAPYGQLPYMICKGKCYGESKAIASFVAKECGLAGKDNQDCMRVDEVYCLVGSLLEEMAKFFFEADAAKKAELQKKLGTESFPKYLGYFEKMLKETGTGYIVGSALTQADLTVYDITYSLVKMDPKILDAFPEIQKMRKNLEANPKVKGYLDSRPAADF